MDHILTGYISYHIRLNDYIFDRTGTHSSGAAKICGCTENKYPSRALSVFICKKNVPTLATTLDGLPGTMASSTWPWLEGCGLAIADPPMPPVNEYDDRSSVKELIATHRKVIDEVRNELKSDPLYNPSKHDDLWILRFVLSHSKKVKASVEAAKYTLAFRSEHNLDAADIRYKTPFDGFAKDSFELYFKYCTDDALTFSLPDENRGVVAFINIGGVSQHEMVKNVAEEHWLPCFMHFSEWAHQWQDCITRRTGRLTKSVRFIDGTELKITGLNAELSKRDGKTMGIMEDCYPQLLQTLYICHAPSWVQVPWRIIRPFFPNKVKSKFDFIQPATNEKERQRVLKHISLENLPKRYGGLYDTWPVSFPLPK